MGKSNNRNPSSRAAWMISLGIHAMGLCLFAFVRLHSADSQTQVNLAAFVYLEQISQAVRSEPITPKPMLRPIVSKKPMLDLPPVTKTQPPIQIPDSGSFSEALSDDLVSSSMNFFGKRNSAKQICFVVDCSGSMFGRMGLVREQLKTAVEKLAPDQFFSVIFFHEGDTILESGSGLLVRATQASKQKALDLIESVRPSGTTEALGALQRAMQLRSPGGEGPELIYFLTDGFDLEEAGAILFVRQTEKMRKALAPRAAIHTIGFWTQREDRWILESLASQSGGDFISVESGKEE